MNALDLYRRTRALGIRLEVVEGRVAFDAPAGAVTPEILSDLRSSKAELLDLLSHPGDAARRLWAETLKEVSRAWVDRVANFSDEEKDRLWLDEAVDAALQADIKDGILSEDLNRTLDAVCRWRDAWVMCVRGDQNDPDPLFCASYASPASPGIGRDGPALPGEPLSREQSEGDGAPGLTQILADATALDGPPANPSVQRMFDEAHERFAEHLQPDTFTTWLKRNAPGLHEEWPDAPPNASWFDWQLFVPEVASEALSNAWEQWLQQRNSNAASPEPTPRTRGDSK